MSSAIQYGYVIFSNAQWYCTIDNLIWMTTAWSNRWNTWDDGHFKRRCHRQKMHDILKLWDCHRSTYRELYIYIYPLCLESVEFYSWWWDDHKPHIYIYTWFIVRGIYEPVKIHLLISIYIYNGLYYQVYQGLLLLTMEININKPLEWDWDKGVLRGLCAWINYNDLTSRPQWWNDGECRG